MKDTRLIMGMPITVEIVGNGSVASGLEEAFDYFTLIDRNFSIFKEDSEVSRFNRGLVREEDFSDDLQALMALCQKTRRETDGYFDPWDGQKLNPSGVVKGWAIRNAALKLERRGFNHFYVEAGGDIQARGMNADGVAWSVGIRNPFDIQQIVKVIYPGNRGVATSGTYIRGQHIWNPKKRNEPITEIVSLTVIGPDILEADRFATPAFAMGRKGIEFIERLDGFEGYMIDKDGIATMTSGFEQYTNPQASA